jgi:hypothetical protein
MHLNFFKHRKRTQVVKFLLDVAEAFHTQFENFFSVCKQLCKTKNSEFSNSIPTSGKKSWGIANYCCNVKEGLHCLQELRCIMNHPSIFRFH